MDSKEIFLKCKDLIKSFEFENLAENMLNLQIASADSKHIEFLCSSLNTQLEEICDAINIKANSLNKLDEDELKHLKDSMNKIKRAKIFLKNYIEKDVALKLNKTIEMEVSKVILEAKNSKDLIEKLELENKPYEDSKLIIERFSKCEEHDINKLQENFFILEKQHSGKDKLKLLTKRLNANLKSICETLLSETYSLIQINEDKFKFLYENLKVVKLIKNILTDFIDMNDPNIAIEIEIKETIEQLYRNQNDDIKASLNEATRKYISFLVGQNILNQISVNKKKETFVQQSVLKPANNLRDSERFIPNIKKNELNSKEQYILISGSADDEAKKQLYECLFQIKYDSSIEQREYNRFKIIEQTDLNRLEFNKTNFIDKCNKIKNNLKAIICLENLNPRPETLLNDVKILSECFTSNELKEKIFFVFTFSNGSKDLAELRNDILKFNTLFDYLMVSEFEKSKFCLEKVWILNKINQEELTTLKHIFKVNIQNKPELSYTKNKSCYIL